MLKNNIENIKKRIEKICQRSARKSEDVLLLAATKGRSVNQIKEVFNCGITTIGENRIQELKEKIPHLPKNLRIDFIGHLQTNKVKNLVNFCELIHSVDSVRLAQEIDKQAKKIEKKQNILLEVNIAEEPTKFGFKKNDLIVAIPKILKLTNINPRGLMTMAPYFEDKEKSRQIFKDLREIRDSLQENLNIYLPDLSMGMSDDYEVAIEEGATIIRLGRILFDVSGC
jgi:pyridoxal phosphate enzyme (YggS family)